MSSNYNRVIGMRAKDQNGKQLGVLHDVYNDGSLIVCNIDGDYEIVAVSLEEVHDLIRGPSASFVRVKVA